MELEGIFLDSRIRRFFQDPYRILEGVGIREGDNLLDVGCGTGFLTIPAAMLVGEEGRVYAVDNNPEYLRRLGGKLQNHGLTNVVILNSEAEKMDEITNSSINKAIMLFSLHHFKDKQQALQRTYDKLIKGGVLMIIDPVKSRMLGHGTNPEEMIKYSKALGYEVLQYEKRTFTWKTLMKK